MNTNVLIRPALFKDIFSDDCELIPNKITFEYSLLKKELQGPYNIQDGYYDQEYFKTEYLRKVLWQTPVLFVLDFQENESTITIQIKLRKALPSDLKVSSSEMKLNYSYFIYENNKFLGPFTLIPTTPKNDIKYWLDNERIYIIDYADKQQKILLD